MMLVTINIYLLLNGSFWPFKTVKWLICNPKKVIYKLQNVDVPPFNFSCGELRIECTSATSASSQKFLTESATRAIELFWQQNPIVEITLKRTKCLLTGIIKRNKTLSKNIAGFNIGITSHKLSEYAFVLFVDDKSNLEHASKTWNVVCGIQDKFCAVFSNCSIKLH